MKRITVIAVIACWCAYGLFESNGLEGEEEGGIPVKITGERGSDEDIPEGAVIEGDMILMKEQSDFLHKASESRVKRQYNGGRDRNINNRGRDGRNRGGNYNDGERRKNGNVNKCRKKDGRERGRNGNNDRNRDYYDRNGNNDRNRDYYDRNGNNDRNRDYYDRNGNNDRNEYYYENDGNGGPSPECRNQFIREEHWAARWTNKTIYYRFDPSGEYTFQQKGEIERAMKTIERWTCIKFRPYTYDDKYYINFVDGEKCKSFVGMLGRKQSIILKKEKCRHMATYLHELLHAAGLLHEHSLPQRSRFVNIYPTNMMPEDQSNVVPEYTGASMVNYRKEYDMNSVMHYSAKANSMNGEPSLSTGDPWMDRYLGQSHKRTLSFGDVKSLNKFYTCDYKCPQEEADHCEGGGGVLLEDCKCLYPYEYDDKTCKDKLSLEDCHHQLLSGNCFDSGRRLANSFRCPKTCGFCGVFRYNSRVDYKDQQCDDYHFDTTKCEEFKLKGYCNDTSNNYHKWMEMHCRKTCDKCRNEEGDIIPVCPNNIYHEASCFSDLEVCKGENSTFYENMGGKEKQFRLNLKNEHCRYQCEQCGYRIEGNCTNNINDTVCESQADDCFRADTRTIVQMFRDCPKTCNRCGFSQGNCTNTYPNDDCDIKAAENHCTGGSLKKIMHDKCKKSCNTCDSIIVR